MWHSGIGRYTSQERQKNLEDTINALASIVPKFGYIMGKATPTRVDASVFGFLTSVLISAEYVSPIFIWSFVDIYQVEPKGDYRAAQVPSHSGIS